MFNVAIHILAVKPYIQHKSLLHPEGLIISFPCRTDGQKIEIVQGVNLNEFSRAKFDASVQELAEEREAVKDLI